MCNDNKKLIDAKRIGKKLECPHCRETFPIASDTVSKMAAPKVGGCTHCATCPHCGKSSCAKRVEPSLDYEPTPPQF